MRKRALIGLAAGAILALGCGLGSTSEAESPDTSVAPAKSKQDKKEETPGIGDPARDGKFEFVIVKMGCGKTKLGTAPFDVKAQGEFCIVDVKVKNIGKEAQTLFADVQKAYAGKVEFSADGLASTYADDRDLIFKEINPGNQIAGVFVYDVPKGTKITHFEFHDSMFSGGVTVENK